MARKRKEAATPKQLEANEVAAKEELDITVTDEVDEAAEKEASNSDIPSESRFCRCVVWWCIHRPQFR